LQAGDDFKTLREIADKLRDCALKGEPWAIQMIADRTDGKVAQAITGALDEPGLQVHHTIRRIIVRPGDIEPDPVPHGIG
jgi:hypothetical protein